MKKNFQDEEFPHQSFLPARQKIKKKGNAFANNMSTEIKLGWLIQSGGFIGKILGYVIGSLGYVIDPAVPLANILSN